jgi:leucyl aminopeptidase
MLDMHLDKHGSCSVLSAMKAISKLKLKANVTASFGFA